MSRAAQAAALLVVALAGCVSEPVPERVEADAAFAASTVAPLQSHVRTCPSIDPLERDALGLALKRLGARLTR